MGRGCVRNLRPHRCLPRGNPQDRAASPRPRCIASFRISIYVNKKRSLAEVAIAF
ncbi:MAG: hypothetical protein F6J90_13345 [Moorea sp. SIOASIH]|uniref:hypothetical protein n=1 Tax=Moorena sp. SIOASIH TaxID=2607817 RepID=UPI0013B5DF90|nr:hypothetical protein [Moorena sp. SIOASIH]NEO37251.1 hypothetical protein [Moorena sp. SIOASIH]